MTFAIRARRLSFAAAATVALAAALPAVAQEVSDSHLQAARAAVDAINATDSYDAILPQAAAALKSELIQKNPDLQALISATVDEKALALAGRRADLEREAALAYARVFPEADLNAIAAFYTSPAGLKLLADGPIVTREVARAADIWSRGIARDLAQEVGTAIAAAVGAQQQVAPGDGAAPSDGAAPAEGSSN